jgi:hypothetical protein
MFHGVYKVDGGPVANAGLLVGRNVWDVKDAERRLEAASPGENILLFGLEVVALLERNRVTFGAAATVNIYLPLARSGVWAGSAEAGTVAGMVSR